MNNDLSAISQLKEKLAASAPVGRGSYPVPASGYGRRWRLRTGSSTWRNLRLVCEMGWLTFAMTVQMDVPGARGFVIACGMLVAYIVVYFGRSGRISPLIWLLSLGLALGSLGGLSTENLTDVYEPLHLGLCCLAVMGFFVSEYNRQEDARFLARLIVILLPIAVWQSIARNGLAEEWAHGGRRGVNLTALFLMLAGTYCFLFRKRWTLLGAPFIIAVLLLGSRTTAVTALAFVVVYGALNRNIRGHVLQSGLKLVLTVSLIVIASFAFEKFGGEVRNQLGGAFGVERFESNVVEAGADKRTDLTLLWAKTLWERPTWFGQGMNTYAAEAAFDEWPHNGILHVFNGLGVVCGVIYLWACAKVGWRLWNSRDALPVHLVWAAAFFGTMMLRSFGEAQLLVQNDHIAGFAITFGSGLAIWGAEYRPRNSYRKRKIFVTRA